MCIVYYQIYCIVYQKYSSFLSISPMYKSGVCNLLKLIIFITSLCAKKKNQLRVLSKGHFILT